MLVFPANLTQNFGDLWVVFVKTWIFGLTW